MHEPTVIVRADPRQPRPQPPLTGERRLAAAVVAQALEDARRGNQRARDWLLNGSDGLKFWAGVAGLDIDVIREQAAEVLDVSVPADEEAA